MCGAPATGEVPSGWVWVPACYKWTPCGWVFVSGYWDAPLCERGLLFAPSASRGPSTCGAASPTARRTSCSLTSWSDRCFVRSTTRTYFFGNYFEASYRRRYVSWVD